ncbi:MAG: TetR/AcrR family transcriptional regulator [Acidimicrobiales bacterium]|nr:TetR/AcrR family transcriptional regulator [Acidimicrobiales bacterium]
MTGALQPLEDKLEDKSGDMELADVQLGEGQLGEAGAGPESRLMRADARRNHARLVDAARQVFSGQGGGASMEAIAKQAGVGVGTLYRHFPRRIDVVEAVYRDDVDSLVDAADRLAERPPWEALEGWLRAYVDYGRVKRTFLNELHEAFEKNPALKPASRERITVACGRILSRAQEAGVARTDIDGDDLMQLVSPMCVAATLTAEQGDRLLAMILDGLRPPASRSDLN